MREPDQYSIFDRWIDRRDRELGRPWATGHTRSRRKSIYLNQFLDGIGFPDPRPLDDGDDPLDGPGAEGGAR